ncbi:MAG: C25 family cysteine peptidase, partial [Flammeovirgaceae bacterium]
GWVGQPVRQNESVDYVIILVNNTVPSSGLPQLEMLVVGMDGFPHVGQLLVGNSFRSIANLNFFGYDKQLITAPLQWSDIAAGGTLVIRLSASAAANNRFQMSVCYVNVTFPQSFNGAASVEKFYYINPNASNKSYIEIENPAPSLRIWDVTDDDNVYMVGTRPVGGAVSAVLNNTSTPRRLFTANQVNSTVVQPISFRNLTGTTSNFIIVTNKLLMRAAGGYANPVQAFASYRASVQGGSYDTLVLTMDQLYNQFNYGETSSLAIYECMKYLVANGNPKFLFLLGKGRDIKGFSAYQRKVAPIGEVRDLVPSAGIPGADMAFTAGLGGTTFEPKVSTGRLPAINSLQVANYLNKVKELESAQIAAAWKKNGLHLSGGIQSFELPLFKSYVDGFKQIAQANFWGASVATISKRDPNPVQLINVADQVNRGVNLITFFGHSSPGTIDIDIGFASDPVLGYNNPGKYPVFLINGCNAGAFFLNGTLFGEDWILSSNKGARNFIAHSSFGFPNTLRAYSELFYQVGFADSVFIQRGIGEVQQEVAKRYLNLYGNSLVHVTQIQQMMMLGDPAVKLFGTSKPDFLLDNNSVTLQSLDGKPVTALSNSFALRIVVKNTGATTPKKMPVRVLRTFSDNSSVTYDSVFTSTVLQDTLLFKIRRDARGGGQNIFTISIDQANTIAETNKLNNSTVFAVLIPSNATKNLLPDAFSIVNSTAPNLLFQSTNLLGDKRDFQIQVDTAASFNSPWLKSQVVNAKVLAKTSVNLLSRDSTTYYWRTRLDKPSASESSEWNTTSFTYINNGPEGWGQFQFPQLLDNSVEGILKDAQERKLKYLETVIPVAVTTYGSNFIPSTATSVKINNIEYNLGTQGQPCRTNTINIIAFDKSTGVPYAGVPFNFQDPRTCGREPQVINSFALSEMESSVGDDLIAAISNLNQSDSVVVFSIGNPSYSSWSANLKSKFTELGIGVAQW